MPGECYLTRQRAYPCKAMAARLTGKGCIGIRLLTTLDITISEWNETVQGFVYAASRNDNGLMLNYCPWCGARFFENRQPIYRDETPVPAAREDGREA
jgi:hypothetical protein